MPPESGIMPPEDLRSTAALRHHNEALWWHIVARGVNNLYWPEGMGVIISLYYIRADNTHSSVENCLLLGHSTCGVLCPHHALTFLPTNYASHLFDDKVSSAE